MKSHGAFGFILSLSLLGSFPVSSQEIFFNRVLPPEGKTFLHVTGMVQDKSGYMWLATKKGLFRYDGYQMTVFNHNPSDTNSIVTDELEAICMDSAGILWIATLGKGLERFDPETSVFKHFRHNPTDAGSIGSMSISAVSVDREGTLWIGTSNGLDRYDAQTGKFFHYRNNSNEPTSISCNSVVKIYEDKQGELWVGTGSVYSGNSTDGGLNRLDRKTGKFTRYTNDPNNPSSLINNKVRAIFEDSKGNFWIGTAGDGLHLMDRKTGKFQRHPFNPVHPENLSRPPIHKLFGRYDHITFITEDISGAIWIGSSESGLNHFNPRTKRITNYLLAKDTVGAFTSRTSWAVYSSREGVLWISSLHGDLFRINPLRYTIAFSKSSLGAVAAFYEEENGKVWLGTHKGWFNENNAKGTLGPFVSELIDKTNFKDSCIRFLQNCQQGNTWWITTCSKKAFLFDKKKQTFIFYQISNDISCVYQDKKENFWVGTSRGLNRMSANTGSFNHYLFHPKDTNWLGQNFITSIIGDSRGLIWAGCLTNGGVQQINPVNKKFKTFLAGTSIFCMYEDADATLWIGGDKGLFQYNRKAGSFHRFVDSTATKEINFATSIIEDDQKNLWVTTPEGFNKIDRSRKQTLLFGKDYGVYKNNHQPLGACYKARNGKLYMGADNGYYAFYPHLLPRNVKPPEILLSAFRLSDKLIHPDKDGPLQAPIALANQINLQHHQNVFSFNFAAIDYVNPDDNRHFFMLENYDAGWNEAGSDRRAIYFNVPPGSYVFRVKAVNSYGVWAEKSISIVITPPWWSNWWLRIATAIFIVAALYGLIRWRLHKNFKLRLEQAEKNKQLAELKHKAAELEMQALRSQMNPHFIFNSLNAINRFILHNNKSQASEYLTKFSRLVRLILQNSQASFISLDSELESLTLYLELEALRFDHHFDYTIDVEDELDLSVIKLPPMIIQPYVENAIWHGLMHKHEKGHLSIELREENNSLLCRIIDDGIGRKKAAELKSKSASSHKSMGMRITADRMAILQEEKQKDCYVVINDLVLADGTAGGTEVILKIPVHYA